MKLIASISIIVFLLLAGCLVTETITVQNGDTVAVDYVGTFNNGQVFDTSIRAEAARGGLALRESYAPLTFVVGTGQVIRGFDDAVIGMKPGQEKNVSIPPEQAYGQRNPEYVVNVSKDSITGNVNIGDALQGSDGTSGTVTAINNETITVDFNSPMAGQTLNFRIILVNATRG